MEIEETEELDEATSGIVADFFINKAIETGHNITSIKLQKLITYAYVWYLGLRGKRLFEEGIKKSHDGYIVESQFERFELFGFIPIVLYDFEYKNKFSYSTNEFLDNIWDVYGRFEGWYLSALQCRELPYKESEAFFIDDKSIEEFYTQKNKEIAYYIPEGVFFTLDDQYYLPIICFTPEKQPIIGFCS